MLSALMSGDKTSARLLNNAGALSANIPTTCAAARWSAGFGEEAQESVKSSKAGRSFVLPLG